MVSGFHLDHGSGDVFLAHRGITDHDDIIQQRGILGEHDINGSFARYREFDPLVTDGRDFQDSSMGDLEREGAIQVGSSSGLGAFDEDTCTDDSLTLCILHGTLDLSILCQDGHGKKHGERQCDGDWFK